MQGDSVNRDSKEGNPWGVKYDSRNGDIWGQHASRGKSRILPHYLLKRLTIAFIPSQLEAQKHLKLLKGKMTRTHLSFSFKCPWPL